MTRQCRSLLLVALVGLALGCAGIQRPTVLAPPRTPEPSEVVEAIEPAVYERAQAERNEFFEREVERLRADLLQAEESIVALESGFRARHTRADAVSAVAEARIALDRVRERVPWRTERVEEAYAKLEEADRQLEAGHLGATIFFASRAARITDTLRHEARQVALWDARRVIRVARVNLRSGPSQESSIVQVLDRDTPVYPERPVAKWLLVRTPDGRVGWVHASLLERR
jgi:hypothetical protein